jgi:hypothetical protein
VHGLRSVLLTIHALRYRAGSYGLPHIPDGGPLWYCACGQWALEAKRDGRTRTGNNEPAAIRAWTGHVFGPG